MENSLLNYTSQAKIHRTNIDRLVRSDLTDAFDEAIDNFIHDHGHEPNWEMVRFRGGITTTQVIVEIIEDVYD